MNINDEVTITLTKRGVEILEAEREGLDKFYINPPKRPELKPGPHKMQLWEVMQTFGPHIFNGCVMPFETEIQL